MKDIRNALQIMINIANDNQHGYDQVHRNGPNYDCSSLVGTALHNSGFNVSPNSWTGNLKAQLLADGFQSVPINSPRQAGDIFLTEGKHVVMCVNGVDVVSASINENGKTKGGKSGDQTGNEILISRFVTPSYGWQYHLRYVPEVSFEQVVLDVIAGKMGNGSYRQKIVESLGYDYREVQNEVNARLCRPKPVPVVTPVAPVAPVAPANPLDAYTDDQLATQVIRGNFGNGKERENRLGSRYPAVRKIVNARLRG